MNVLVMFGGKSAEHDISVITGCQALNAIDRKTHNVVPVYIDGNGVWWTGKDFENIQRFKDFKSKGAHKVFFRPNDRNLYKDKLKTVQKDVDCAVLCMHGLNGEDGTLQGLLELSGVAYTGSKVLSGALCMDKITCKLALEGLKLPVVKYAFCTEASCGGKKDVDCAVEAINVEGLKYPLIIKPSRLGSSIGISKAADEKELCTAIKLAACFDERILIEECIQSLTEYNCAALDAYGKTLVSSVEIPTKTEDVLTFADKYLRGGKKTGKSKRGIASLKRKIGEGVPKEISESVQSLTKKIYGLLDCAGVVRVDYIYDENEKKLYINEINTIPGSLGYYLWQEQNISFSCLINILIDGAVEYKNRQNQKQYSYISSVL